MPQRTNEKQQVIEMLKALLAPQGCTVTPSKLLNDSRLNSKREVDVVAETPIDGHLFVQSFEIVGRGRPIDLPWVESMLQKHQGLPTDRLYLVSWSGFTEDASRLAVMTPKTIPVTVSATNGALRLYANQINLRLQRASPRVRRPDGTVVAIRSDPDLTIFSAREEVLGTLWALGTWLLRLPSLGQFILQTLEKHPQRHDGKWFELDLPLNELAVDELYLRMDDPRELHRMIELNLQGEIAFSSEHLDLNISNFQDESFGHGDVVLGGTRHLIVASLDSSGGVEGVRVERERFGKQPR